LRNTQAIAQSNFFWIENPIQIHHKYVIDNPIQIQLFLEKDIGQQILNGQVL